MLPPGPLRRRLLLGAALVLAGTTALAAPKPPPCGGGRYLLPAGEVLLDAAALPALDAIVLTDGGGVEVASGCPEQAARLKARKRGTRVKAKWPAGRCGALRGRLRLKAKIDTTCTTMKGKLSAKGFRKSFVARRSACGDGVLDRDGGEVCPLLEGNPGASAADATVDFDAGDPPVPDEMSVDAAGATVVRTQLEVGLQSGASIGEVNGLLGSFGGEIVSMLAGVPILGLRIPDPESAEGLEALVAQVAADPVVRFVRKAFMPVPHVVPVLTPPLNPTFDFKFVEHHLAVGAGAAWNVRAALPSVASRPFVVVDDNFGNGPPDDAFDVDERDFDFGIGAPDDHGYHVLGIIAARFDGLADPTGRRGRDVATGIFPGTVPIRVVEGSRLTVPRTGSSSRSRHTLPRARRSS